jgi:hypothetical protein
MSGVAVPLGRVQFIDPLTDEPLALGTVEHYVPFTMTPKTTWADQGQTTLNVNPLTLNAAGQPSGGIWGDGLYRQIVKRANGSVIWDLVTGFLGSGGGGGGDVFGPGASVVGNFAIWTNTLGTQVGDGGVPGALAFLSVAPVANGGTGASTAANARIALGLQIGTDVQAYSANLAGYAGLASAADKLGYFTGGAGAQATTTFTAFARTILDDADGPAVLVTIGAEPRGAVVGINTQTASYVAVLADAGQIVEMNVAGANTFTVPPNSSVAFPVKTRIDVVQIGVGQTTITPGAGVTLRSKSANLKLAATYTGCSIYKRGTDEWVVLGDLVA